MQKRLNIYGVINSEGRLSKNNSISIKNWMEHFKGGVVSITLSVGKKRSNPQNAYYWGVVLPLVQDLLIEAGYQDTTITDVHEFLKKEFNCKEIEIDGHFLNIPQSTTALTTNDFNDYIEKISRFTAEFFGFVMPEPNEQLEFRF